MIGTIPEPSSPALLPGEKGARSSSLSPGERVGVRAARSGKLISLFNPHS